MMFSRFASLFQAGSSRANKRQEPMFSAELHAFSSSFQTSLGNGEPPPRRIYLETPHYPPFGGMRRALLLPVGGGSVT